MRKQKWGLFTFTSHDWSADAEVDAGASSVNIVFTGLKENKPKCKQAGTKHPQLSCHFWRWRLQDEMHFSKQADVFVQV